MNQNDVDRILYLQEKASEMREKMHDAKTIQNKVIYLRLARNYERKARRLDV